MIQPNPAMNNGILSSDTTTVFPTLEKNSLASDSKRKVCGLALPGQSSVGPMGDITCLLRHRLSIAAAIAASVSSIFFLRNLFESQGFFGFGRYDVLVQGIIAATLILITTLLMSRVKLSKRQLRIVEFVQFGSMAAYFTWLGFVMFHEGRLLQWANPDHLRDFLRLANASNILRWFGLIVVYGTFVPNTWKRCAIFTSIWAGLPIISMVLMNYGCPTMGPYLGQSVFDLIVMLGTASAIAIFGSYKISELQQEAVQAKKLGQYQLKELIGSGGMGQVYLGEHMMLRRACAIKIIRPEQTRDATSLSRFQREVKAMARLTHWNTVEVYDYGLAPDGTFYYVMEYLPGLSLQQLVEQYGPLTPGRTVHFLRQVCDALKEAHANDLIHRDVKPSNVIACERGGVCDVAKLLDFGLVQGVGVSQEAQIRLTMQGMVLGSPPYMSPEQALGKDTIDCRSDIYSVGGLAYFLLTGHPTFDRDTPMQVLMAHVYDEVVPPSEIRPDIPKDLEAIILRCLQKNREDRFPDAESLDQALEDCSAAHDWDRAKAAQWWRGMRQQRMEKDELVSSLSD